MPLSLTDMITGGLLDELAKVFGMSDNADLLLTRAGFPRMYRPERAAHPRAYWEQVCQMIENGVVGGLTLESALACAAKMYEGNQRFQPFGSRPLPQPLASPAAASQRHDVFIAYATRDQAEVERIAVTLRDRGVSVWFDKWSLPGGAPLSRTIDQALRDVPCICVCVGSDIGPWQQLEVEAAINLFAHDPKKRLIPTLLSSAPEKPYMPLTLHTVAWVRFNDGRSHENGVDDLIRAIRA